MQNALATFFSASSVAVIGASREREKVGYQILDNLKSSGKTLYPINPSAQHILGLKVYPSILDVLHPIDVAVVVVPAQFVQQVLDDCIEKKVKAVLIITAGFAETSEQGKQVQAQFAAKLKQESIELLGPNSLGLLCPPKHFNCSFAGKEIKAGSLGVISQSGAMLTALFTEMVAQGVGCSFAVSLGNKAGLSENEALEFAIEDEHTKTIGVYLESFSDLPNFFKLCSNISKKKPIILLKGGRTKSGQTASVSHTAALATNDILLKAGAAQFGYVMVDTVEEFLQTMFFLERHRSLPENTMVITNAGGPGVNTVDVSEMKKVSLAEWSPASVKHIEETLPMVHVANPLDLIGDANEDRFAFALRQAQRDPQIDSLVVIITQQAVTDVPKIVETLIQSRGKKPVCVALITGDRFADLRKKLQEAGIFATNYPNQIIDVLSIVKQAAEARYIKGRFEPLTSQHQSLQTHTAWQDYAHNIDHTFQLLGEFGFRTPIYSFITDEEQLSQVHLPSFAKTANLALPHKKDIGAIYGVVNNRYAVEESYRKLKSFGNAVLYQEIIQADLELLLGMHRDLQFGPYIAIGLGGSWTNVLSDRSYVFAPTSKRVLKAALMQTKAFRAIEKLSVEYRQNLLQEIVNLMDSLQKLMQKHPEIQELEINPLMINTHGVWAADVKIQTL